MYVTDTQMCLIKSLESVLGLSVLVCDALTKKKLSDCHVRYAGIDHIMKFLFLQKSAINRKRVL